MKQLREIKEVMEKVLNEWSDKLESCKNYERVIRQALDQNSDLKDEFGSCELLDRVVSDMEYMDLEIMKLETILIEFNKQMLNI